MAREDLAEPTTVGVGGGDCAAADLRHHLRGGLPVAGHAGQEARGLRHAAAEVEHRECGYRARRQDKPPLQIAAHAQRIQEELEERRGQGADRPHGSKSEAQRPAPVRTVGMLGHDHRREHVVRAYAHAEHEPDGDQPGHVRRERLSQGGDAEDEHIEPVEPPAALLAEHAEDKGADRRPDQRRGRQKGALHACEARLAEGREDLRQHQRHRGEIVAVAEHPKTGGERRAPMEGLEPLVVESREIPFAHLRLHAARTGGS